MENKNLKLTFGLLRNAFTAPFIIELSFTKSNKKELTPISDASRKYDMFTIIRLYEAEDTIGVLLNGVPKNDKQMTVNEIIESLNIHQPISFAFNGYDSVKFRYEYTNPSDIPEIFKDVAVASIEALPNIKGHTGFELTLDCAPPYDELYNFAKA